MLGLDRVDLVVLGRCMQIVTDRLIEPYRYRLINIHRSMLPALMWGYGRTSRRATEA